MTKLIFVYNAKSGFVSSLIDYAHKTIKPETYSCNLCALTFNGFSQNKKWKDFLDGLDLESEFLHKDELKEKYKLENVALPAMFKKSGNNLELAINAEEINAVKSVEDLILLVKGKI